MNWIVEAVLGGQRALISVGFFREPLQRDRFRGIGEKTMLSKPLMTVKEASDMLKLKEGTIRNLINDRKLRAVKFGKEWRIAPKDLELFLNDNANL
jgi:excisionase family DNA binding protein